MEWKMENAMVGKDAKQDGKAMGQAQMKAWESALFLVE